MIVILMIQQIIIKSMVYNFCFVVIFKFLVAPSDLILKMSFEFFLGYLKQIPMNNKFFFV